MVTTETAWDIAAGVPDPEIPVVTVAELGILRSVDVDESGGVMVTITPTYSGCPAMDTMETDIVAALHNAGYATVQVETQLSPPWTTDWISDQAKDKLEAFGIAPPAHTATTNPAIVCPQCKSSETRTISEFGSTACKALMVCSVCAEPFDRFKAL